MVTAEAEGDSPKPLMKPIQIGLHQLKHRYVSNTDFADRFITADVQTK